MTKLQFLALLNFTLIACTTSTTLDQNSQDVAEVITSVYQKDTLANGDIRFRPNYSAVALDTFSINLDFFDTIPETISNVGDFFTYDTTRLVNSKYIFLTNLVEYGVIKNNGKDIYLRKEHEKCIALTENTFKDIYAGNGYSVTLIHKTLDHNNGTTYGTGTLEIKNSKHKTEIKVHGGYKL